MATRPGLRTYAVAIFLLAAASGLTSLGNGFALDDVPIIQNNAAVHAFDVEAIWTGPSWPGGEGLGLYRPLTTTLFAAQWAVGDGSPLPYHVVSLHLHEVGNPVTMTTHAGSPGQGAPPWAAAGLNRRSLNAPASPWRPTAGSSVPGTFPPASSRRSVSSVSNAHENVDVAFRIRFVAEHGAEKGKALDAE